MSLTKRKMEEGEWRYEFQYEDYYDDDYWSSKHEKVEDEWVEYEKTDWKKYEPVQKNYPIFNR